MIKAQLSHNPYLMETKVLFNNRAPRINSLVEKYQEGPLHTWIKMIPTIFHDEMNGYNFELEYSGTNLDFQELQKAFKEAEVSDKMVHLFHKNVLDGREEKQELITKLLNWIEANPNELFDSYQFIEGHQLIVCPNHHSIIHDTNPVFNRKTLTYKYPNGFVEGLAIEGHLRRN